METYPSACYSPSTKEWLLNFKQKTHEGTNWKSFSTTHTEYHFLEYPTTQLKKLQDLHKNTTNTRSSVTISLDDFETIQVILDKEDNMLSIISTNKLTNQTKLDGEYIITPSILHVLEPKF